MLRSGRPSQGMTKIQTDTDARDNDVRGHGEGVKHIRHPVLGPIAFEHSVFAVDGLQSGDAGERARYAAATGGHGALARQQKRLIARGELRGLNIRLEQARGVAVRDNRSTGHVLELLDAITANVAALRRVLAAREVKMDK
jgi:hypothetical protein